MKVRRPVRYTHGMPSMRPDPGIRLILWMIVAAMVILVVLWLLKPTLRM